MPPATPISDFAEHHLPALRARPLSILSRKHFVDGHRGDRGNRVLSRRPALARGILAEARGKPHVSHRLLRPRFSDRCPRGAPLLSRLDGAEFGGGERTESPPWNFPDRRTNGALENYGLFDLLLGHCVLREAQPRNCDQFAPENQLLNRV